MLEGIEGSSHHDHDAKSLFFGILFHQIPVAIALMTMLTQSKLSNLKSWLFLIAFGVMTPFGIGLGLIIPAENLGIDEHVILAVVVGIFLHISTTIIFETSENHKFNLLKLVSILIGCAFAFALNWI
jgi:zinc transporter ZupT